MSKENASPITSSSSSKSYNSSSSILSQLTLDISAIKLSEAKEAKNTDEHKKETKESKIEVLSEENLIPENSGFISPPVTAIYQARESWNMPADYFGSPQHITAMRTEEGKLDSKRRKPKVSPQIAPSLSALPNFLPTKISPERLAAIQKIKTEQALWNQRVAQGKTNGAKRSKGLISAFKKLKDLEESESLQGLQQISQDPARMLTATHDGIIEHNARRITAFFYKLITFHNTSIVPIQGQTTLQHGKGHKSAMTEGCHSSIFPHLIDDSILIAHPFISYRNNTQDIPRTGILSGTHFSNFLNATVELSALTNDIDGRLEGHIEQSSEFRQKSLVILQQVAQGLLDPIAGITQFIKLLQDSLREMRDTNDDAHEVEILQTMFEAATTDKYLHTTMSEGVNPQFIDMMLRLLPGEIWQCEQGPDFRRAIYVKKMQIIQREILNSAGAFVISEEYSKLYTEKANQFYKDGKLEEALEFYRYALCYTQYPTALKKAISDLETHLIAVYTSNGDTYCSKSEFGAAIQQYEAALSLYPSSSIHSENKLHFYLVLSECYFRLQHYQTALDYCMRGLKLIPNQPQMLLQKQRVESPMLPISQLSLQTSSSFFVLTPTQSSSVSVTSTSNFGVKS